MTKEGHVATITFEKLIHIFGGDFNKAMKGNEESHEVSILKKPKETRLLFFNDPFLETSS